MIKLPIYFIYKIDEKNCINDDSPCACFKRFKDALMYVALIENPERKFFMERYSEKRGYMNDDARCLLKYSITR